MAAQLNVDGIALYETPESKFMEEYGFEGVTIYNSLCRSKYGYVSLSSDFNIKESLLTLIEV